VVAPSAPSSSPSSATTSASKGEKVIISIFSGATSAQLSHKQHSFAVTASRLIKRRRAATIFMMVVMVQGDGKAWVSFPFNRLSTCLANEFSMPKAPAPRLLGRLRTVVQLRQAKNLENWWASSVEFYVRASQPVFFVQTVIRCRQRRGSRFESTSFSRASPKPTKRSSKPRGLLVPRDCHFRVHPRPSEEFRWRYPRHLWACSDGNERPVANLGAWGLAGL